MQNSNNKEMVLGGLLAKYTHLKRPNEVVRNAVSEAITGILGVEIPIEDISVQNGVVYVSAHTVLKNEIAIHQKKIIEKLTVLLKEDIPNRVT